jgi:hypothetical protein
VRRWGVCALIILGALTGGTAVAVAFFADAAEQLVDVRADRFGEWATVSGCERHGAGDLVGLVVGADGCTLTLTPTTSPEAGVVITTRTAVTESDRLTATPQGEGRWTLSLREGAPRGPALLTVRFALSDGSTLHVTAEVTFGPGRQPGENCAERCALMVGKMGASS